MEFVLQGMLLFKWVGRTLEFVLQRHTRWPQFNKSPHPSSEIGVQGRGEEQNSTY